MSKDRGEVLFELPIGDSGKDGSVVVSQPAKQVYLLTFCSGADNRLISGFCQTIVLALDIIEEKYEAGVVITTSGIDKFYSNGLDLNHATYTPGFWKESLYPLWHRLITYPMPTIAWVNGHAFAGGFMVAMFHDYRIMNPHKGYLCLNELDLGVPLRPPMMSVFKQKVGSPVLRRMILEGVRFKALDALKENLVDWLGSLEEALSHIEELKLVAKAQPGLSGISAYAPLKQEMWRETIELLEATSDESIQLSAKELQRKREKAERGERVKVWEEKSKL